MLAALVLILSVVCLVRPEDTTKLPSRSPEATSRESIAPMQANAVQLLDVADDLAAGNASTTAMSLYLSSRGADTVTVGPGMRVRYSVVGQLSDDHNEGLALIGFSLRFSGGPLQHALTPTGDPESGCENPMIHFTKPWGITNPEGYGGTIINGELIQIGGGQNTFNNTPDNADFPIGSVLTGVAQPGGCGPAVIVNGWLTAPKEEGKYTLEMFDVFANIIREGETDDGTFWATQAAQVGEVENLTIVVRRDRSMETE